jgi:hypothetical protein
MKIIAPIARASTKNRIRITHILCLFPRLHERTLGLSQSFFAL